MKLSRALLLCSFTLAALTGCGSDYEANPIVIDTDNDDLIVVDEHNGPVITYPPYVIINPTPTQTSFITTQLAEVKNSLWQSQCTNSKISEMSYSGRERVISTYSFTNSGCTSASPSVVTTTETYTASQSMTDSSGSTAVMIDYTNKSTSAKIYDIFRVENSNRLYLGVPATTANTYSASLNFSTPFFAISPNASVANR